MLSKRLRPYQARAVADVCRFAFERRRDVCLEQPTGSGKTLELLTAIAVGLQGRKVTHALIVAPQRHIERGFVAERDMTVRWPEGWAGRQAAVVVPAGMVREARRQGRGTTRAVLAYLNQPAPGYALACTHAGSLGLVASGDALALPAQLRGMVLVVDEAHHAPADGLSAVVALWQARGGRVVYSTATAFRADGREVVGEGMVRVRRGLAEHMVSGFAPAKLDHVIVPFGTRRDRVTGAQFTGEAADAEAARGLARSVVRRWEADGRPKTIVRVPPLAGGSGPLVSRLVAAFRRGRARVLDATGAGPAVQRTVLGALDAERARSYRGSELDVIVGIQRVIEGTDWPHCSAVYCVGLPRSLGLTAQLIGRALRPKGRECPPSHRDRARVVFFVPTAGGRALDELPFDHSRHALLTCAFLADHEVAAEWVVTRAVRGAARRAAGAGREDAGTAADDRAADLEQAAAPPRARDAEAHAAAFMAAILEERGGTATVGELLDAARAALPGAAPGVLAGVVLRAAGAQPGPDGERVREALRSSFSSIMVRSPTIRTDVALAFEAVLAEFREETVGPGSSFSALSAQIHTLTGRDISAFADRLRRGIGLAPLTEDAIVAWALAHRERTGEFPAKRSGVVVGGAGQTWLGVDVALRQGARGLPGGSSLTKLLAERCGLRNARSRAPLTEDRIVAWALAHERRTGNLPSFHSGPIPDGDGHTWSGVNNALERGFRGLPGRSSLAKLLAERCGHRNHLALPPLTEDWIVAQAVAHKERTGKYPSRTSGAIPGGGGETWGGVHQALYVGSRGLPGGSSLAKLLAERCGHRNHLDLPPLTEGRIVAWALAHRRRTGKYPSEQSGAVRGGAGETWGGVNDALKRGSRGLPGGSSLSRLLRAYPTGRPTARAPRRAPHLRGGERDDL